MLTFLGAKHSFCDGITRRDFLRAGSLGLGGLTLADLLRLKANGAVSPKSAHKAVIMIYLPGGPSHIDMYDMKPDAPAEIRGEFKPIQTNVSGIRICELMPLQARIADKFAIVQGMRSGDRHDAYELLSGISPAGGMGRAGVQVRRPVIGSVVSQLRGADAQTVPPYVSMGDHGLLTGDDYTEDPAYLGLAHRPFRTTGPGRRNLTLQPNVTLDRLQDRRGLLRTFDSLRSNLDDSQGTLASINSFTAQALDMLASTKVRDAFDIDKEADRVRERYGPMSDLLTARRLVEAGVSVVTVPAPVTVSVRGLQDATWDTHGANFPRLQAKLPILDRGMYALLTDLHERGLDQDVAVVMWGEFGRTPRISMDPNACGPRWNAPGRSHWPEAGFVFVAGGGLKTGQVVNATDRSGARLAHGQPCTPQNVLATLYHVLGIDPNQTFLDTSGRPQPLLDDREKIAALC